MPDSFYQVIHIRTLLFLLVSFLLVNIFEKLSVSICLFKNLTIGRTIKMLEIKRAQWIFVLWKLLLLGSVIKTVRKTDLVLVETISVCLTHFQNLLLFRLIKNLTVLSLVEKRRLLDFRWLLRWKTLLNIIVRLWTPWNNVRLIRNGVLCFIGLFNDILEFNSEVWLWLTKKTGFS